MSGPKKKLDVYLIGGQSNNDLDHRADDPNLPYPMDHVHFGSPGTLNLE